MITPPSMRFIKKLPARWRLNWLQAVCSMSLPGVCVVALAGCTPTGPRALLEGKRQLEARQYSKAIEKLKLATSLLPTNAQAWNYLGVASHYAGQAAEAEQAYQRALALNHDLFEARYNLGCLLLEQNKTNAAKNELTAFTLRRANSIEGLLKLGVAQLRCREFVAAEKSFNEVVRLNPNSAQALNGLGLARLGRTRAGEAAQFFNRALKEQPSFRPALLNLAIVAQQHLKNAPLALQKYREYLALKPAPENAEAVRKVVLQLEQELSPPPRASLTNSAPVVGTNSSLAKHQASLAPPPPPPKADTGSLTKTIASPPPAAQIQSQAVEVVNLKEEPVLQPVKDLPPVTPEPEPEVPPSCDSDPDHSLHGHAPRETG